MNEPNFTPGPWRSNIYNREFCDTGEYYTEYTVESPLNICVCQVFEHDNNQHTGEEQASANAALIAAAPEMYKKLEWMQKQFDDSADEELVALGWEIEELLKKARGEK